MRILLAILVLVPLQAQASNGSILILGDSLSAAYNLSMEEGWVSLLEQRLAAEGCEAAVVNASISGETTIGGLNRLPKLIDTHQPSIVIVELGGNDGLRGFPIRQLRQNITQIVHTAREAGAKVLLAGIQIPTNYGRRYTNEFAGIFPDLSRALDVPLIPFLLEGIALDKSLMLPDGIHPNARAQPLLLDNVWPIISPLLDCEASQSPDLS